MADSTVTVVGNVTRDPEMRYTPSGVAKASFGVAVSRRWQNRNTQEWEEQTSFFNVVCWRDMAENVCESIGKGARVVVNGRLEQRSWETENGDKRSVVEIVADDIGPSLRWATAEVRRNERRGSFDSGGGSGGGGAVAVAVAASASARPWPAPRPPTTWRSPSDHGPTTPNRTATPRSASRRRRCRSSTARASRGSTTRTSRCCAGSCRSAPRSGRVA